MIKPEKYRIMVSNIGLDKFVVSKEHLSRIDSSLKYVTGDSEKNFDYIVEKPKFIRYFFHMLKEKLKKDITKLNKYSSNKNSKSWDSLQKYILSSLWSIFNLDAYKLLEENDNKKKLNNAINVIYKYLNQIGNQKLDNGKKILYSLERYANIAELVKVFIANYDPCDIVFDNKDFIKITNIFNDIYDNYFKYLAYLKLFTTNKNTIDIDTLADKNLKKYTDKKLYEYINLYKINVPLNINTTNVKHNLYKSEQIKGNFVDFVDFVDEKKIVSKLDVPMVFFGVI